MIIFSIDLHCTTFIRVPATSPTVHLTVSSMADVSWRSVITKRSVVMNWRAPEDTTPSDWVGLFNKSIKAGQNVTGIVFSRNFSSVKKIIENLFYEKKICRIKLNFLVGGLRAVPGILLWARAWVGYIECWLEP